MTKFWKSLVVVGIFLFLGINLFIDAQKENPAVLSDNPDLPIGISIGEVAPDFEAQTLSGETIHLSDYRGKTILINVFASWCGPCQLEAPHLSQVYADSGFEDVEFIGLNLLESPAEVAAFKTEYGWEFPVILNQDGALTAIYKPLGLPTSWFIDPEGVIQYIHTGPVTQEMLIQVITDVQENRDPNPFAG